MLRSKSSPLFLLLVSLIAAAGLSLVGCSGKPRVDPTPTPAPTPTPIPKGASGSIYGALQAISGAAIQLYAVGSSGDGSAATPLLTKPLFSDASGSFVLTGLYTCPSASALVYITGTGGSPAPGVTNPEIALMAALGPCGSLTGSTVITLNELTTVGAVYALAPFMSSMAAIGSAGADGTALASSFTNAGYFANTSTGTTPGMDLPANESVPVAQINTTADLLAACIRSAGGVSGDASICGSFFALTLPPGGVPSTNTIAALLNLAKNPTLNTAALYQLIPPGSPFQPTQSIIPPDFSLRLLGTSLFTISPSAVAFAGTAVDFTQGPQTITVTNGTTASVNITSTSVTGVNATDFAIVPQPGADCAPTIPANTTCTFQLSFTPSALGARAAYFLVGNSSVNPSIAIALSGSGSAASAGPVWLTPSNLAFTALATPQILTLANAGSTTLSIKAIQISNAAYTQTNNCGSSLAAAASCSINVSVAVGTTATATLTVMDDAATGPQIVNLSYTPPGTIDFGHWAIGTTASENVEVHGANISGTLDFTITGNNTNDFSFAPNSSVLTTSCYYNYRKSSPCYITFFYKPSALGTSTASVTSSGIYGPSVLIGTGDAAGVDFGFYKLGLIGLPYTNFTAAITTLNLGSSVFGTPVTQAFLIHNTGTVTPLVFNAPVVSGPNAAEFAVTTTACDSGCTPSVTFTPTANGPRSATLTYTDTTKTVTRTLALTGTGTTPVPVFNSPYLIFSNVPIGTVSAPQSTTVQAYGNHPIQASLTPINSGGAQPFVFIGPSSCSSTPCTLSIAYAPTSAADSEVNVYITGTDTVGLSSSNIQAYGQVTPYAYVSYNPTSLSFAAQALNTVSAPQTVTFTNAGSTVLTLGFSISLYGGDYAFVNHCPTFLAINTTCTVDVRFAPTSTTGTLSTNLVIEGSNVTRYLPLDGTSF